MKRQVVIIGGGASGLVCAGYAAKRGLDVLIIERNTRAARKLMITGKGRCNITNLADLPTLIKSVTSNGKFLYSAFSAFSTNDTLNLMNSLGVETKVERGNRVFPASNRAVDVVDALTKFPLENGVDFKCSRVIDFNFKDGLVDSVVCDDGEIISCDAVCIATGGLSYPKTGSTGDGYELAKSAGHTIVPTVPSLVPVEVHEGFVYDLKGLSLKNIAIKVIDDFTGKTVFTDFGEMMFAHFGLTGPVILSASAHMRNMQPGRYKIAIDLKPALDLQVLDARIIRDFDEFKNRNFANSLDKLLPKSLIPVIIRLSRISPDKKVNQITKQDRETISSLIKGLTFNVTGFRSIDEAIITSGGIKTTEIDPKTMSSKKVSNLYFAGEVIDVDAYTGGFNLQIAFSTGYLAGNSICKH